MRLKLEITSYDFASVQTHSNVIERWRNEERWWSVKGDSTNYLSPAFPFSLSDWNDRHSIMIKLIRVWSVSGGYNGGPGNYI